MLLAGNDPDMFKLAPSSEYVANLPVNGAKSVLGSPVCVACRVGFRICGALALPITALVVCRPLPPQWRRPSHGVTWVVTRPSVITSSQSSTRWSVLCCLCCICWRTATSRHVCIQVRAVFSVFAWCLTIVVCGWCRRYTRDPRASVCITQRKTRPAESLHARERHPNTGTVATVRV
jgi:hypothetical protein